MLKGHERSITQVKYNLDGDFIFTSAKDNKPTLWYADTGERIGVYGLIFVENSFLFLTLYLLAGHKGAVWDLDPNWDSQYLVTACADGSARLFETTTGRYIARMPHKGSVSDLDFILIMVYVFSAVRSVAWGDSSHLFATASDPFTSREKGLISIFDFPQDLNGISTNKVIFVVCKRVFFFSP